MNLYLRLLRVLLHAFLRPSIRFSQASTVKFRVWLNDIDLNLHMTNSRYLSIMDLGRVDFLVRSGLGKQLLKHKWQAVLGAANIRFRRALDPFQSYQLTTRIVGLDEKWAYIEQRFESNEGLVAYAIVRGVFTSKRGAVAIKDVLHALGLEEKDIKLRPDLEYWNKMDAEIRVLLQKETDDEQKEPS